jgi:hypothetical protein
MRFGTRMDLMALLTLLVLALIALVLIWRAQLALTLFVLRIQNGHVDYVKGRIPRRLLAEIADVAEKGHIQAVLITCRIADRSAQLIFKGNSNPDLEQIIRNLVGQYPLTRLRQAPKARGPQR